MSHDSYSRKVAAFLGSATLGLVLHGCGGTQPVIRQQASTDDRPAIPQITAERLAECVKEYGHQLASGSWAFSPKVQVERDGYLVDVHAGNVPNSAPDFAACTRIVLRDMSIPSWIFNVQSSQPDYARTDGSAT